MELSEFISLSIGSVIYNKTDGDLRRTATNFIPDRLQSYTESGAVMWTRPAFDIGERGYGRDIPLSECGDWTPVPKNVWETKDQELINRYIVLQQQAILYALETLTLRRI